MVAVRLFEDKSSLMEVSASSDEGVWMEQKERIGVEREA